MAVAAASTTTARPILLSRQTFSIGVPLRKGENGRDSIHHLDNAMIGKLTLRRKGGGVAAAAPTVDGGGGGGDGLI